MSLGGQLKFFSVSRAGAMLVANTVDLRL